MTESRQERTGANRLRHEVVQADDGEFEEVMDE